jgi:enterobacterial common antigen flippase
MYASNCSRIEDINVVFNVAVQKIRWILGGKDQMSATLQTLATRIFILAINLATGVITARGLGADGRGIQAALLIWPSLLAFLATLGIPSSITYNLKKYPEKKSSLITTSIILSAIFGVIAMGVGILFIPRWLHQYPSGVIANAQCFMLFTPIILISLTLTSILESRYDFSFSNLSRYVVVLATLGTLLVLVTTGVASPVNFALAYTAPSIPMIFLLARRVIEPVGWTINGFFESCRLIAHYGFRSYGIDLLGTLSAQTGAVLVAGILSPRDLGFYSVTLGVARMLNILQSSVVSTVFPRIAAQPIPKILKIVGQASRISFMGLLALILITGYFAPLLLQFVYGKDFVTASWLFRIFLVETLFHCVTWLLAQAFMAAGQPGIVTVVQATGLVAAVPITIWLTPIYGIEGAGFALLLSTLVRFVLTISCFPLMLKSRPPNIFFHPDDLVFIRNKLKI